MLIAELRVCDKIHDQQHAAWSEPLDEAPRGEREVGEVVEAEADDGEVEAGEGRGGGQVMADAFLGEEVADRGVCVDSLMLGTSICALVGCESSVVFVHHVLADVDADELGCVAEEDVRDGAWAARVVEDADLIVGFS